MICAAVISGMRVRSHNTCPEPRENNRTVAAEGPERSRTSGSRQTCSLNFLLTIILNMVADHGIMILQQMPPPNIAGLCIEDRKDVLLRDCYDLVPSE